MGHCFSLGNPWLCFHRLQFLAAGAIVALAIVRLTQNPEANGVRRQRFWQSEADLAFRVAVPLCAGDGLPFLLQSVFDAKLPRHVLRAALRQTGDNREAADVALDA